MFAQDVTFGRATLLCPRCQSPFVSGAYQARYCSPACRQCQQKRNVREKAKLARSLRAEGQTIRQIAAALDQKVHVVKGWLAPKANREVSHTRHNAPARAFKRENARVNAAI
jgi:hypothetical protein